MKKVFIIFILILFLCFPIISLFSYSDTILNSEDNNNDDDDDVSVEENKEEDLLLKILVKESTFDVIIKSEINFDISITENNSEIMNKTISSDKGFVNINADELSPNDNWLIQASINRDEERFYFDDFTINYPEEVPESGIYEIHLIDRYIRDYVTSDEKAIWDKYTIVMKSYFTGDDMENKDAWKFLLNDETVKHDAEERLAKSNTDINEYIDYLFKDENSRLRSELWERYKFRVNAGYKNYMNMLKSDDIRKVLGNLNIYNVKSPDNIYTAYITVGTYTVKNLDDMHKRIDTLDKWKRESGRKVGYIL
ncbi:MAG: hypothetical protein ACOCV8_05030, partial [Spirochaetota bacterium]